MSILKFQTRSSIIIKLLALLLWTLLISPASSQKEHIYTRTRTSKVPITVINKLSYLHLNDLCQAPVSYQEFGVQMGQWPAQKQSQLEQLTNNNEQVDIAVLLDTGSSELWLADSDCSSCSLTRPLCPHLPSPSKKISYVKGHIEGADSYINICNNRIKFLCVKSAINVGEIKGVGILGLKSHSTGFDLLFQSLAKNKYSDKSMNENAAKTKIPQHQLLFKEIHSVQFIHSVYENYIHIKNIRQMIPLKAQHEQPSTVHDSYDGIKIKSDKDWSFNLEHISIFDSSIILKPISNSDDRPLIKAQIDTGSTQIVLSSDLCGQLLEQVKSQLGMVCRYETNRGIDCSRIVKSVNIALKIDTQPEVKETQIFTIQDKFVVDHMSNRLNILCQAANSNESTAILGHPFLNSFSTTFRMESYLQKVPNSEQIVRDTQYFIVLSEPSPSPNATSNSKLVMIAYVGLAAGLAWGFISSLDYVRDKRSMKIII